MSDNYKALNLSQQLATKFCHDLAGPVGAVNNGIEFLEGSDPDMHKQALELLKLSAEQALYRLQFYRVAYGVASTSGASTFDEVKTLTTNYLKHGKIKLNWVDPEPAVEWQTQRISSAVRQLVAHVVLLLQTELIYGGTLDINFTKNAGKFGIRITGQAEKVKPNLEIAALLQGHEASPLSETTIQPIVLKMVIDHIGCGFDYQISEQTITCDISLNNL